MIKSAPYKPLLLKRELVRGGGIDFLKWERGIVLIVDASNKMVLQVPTPDWYFVCLLAKYIVHKCLKVHQCRSENLHISLSSHENNMPKVSNYKSIFFLSYSHSKFLKCLFTNIQKQ